MDDKKSDPRIIAEEAVGQARGSPTPDAAKAEMPTEEVIRRLAMSAGPQADIAAQTAESVRARAGGAYATSAGNDSEPGETIRRQRPTNIRQSDRHKSDRTSSVERSM